MIDLAKYKVLIQEDDLVSLTNINELTLYADLSAGDKTAFEAEIEAAEVQAKAIITQRFGIEPTDTNFLETATIAGVVYLLSRKSANQISGEELDARRAHFYDMLPGTAGAQTQASATTYVSKLGNWI